MPKTPAPTWIVAVAAIASACRSAPDVVPSGDEQLPPAASALPDAGSGFAGRYSSTEGPATISEAGAQVAITYARGFAKCTATGRALACTWHEGKNYGQASVTKRSDGKLVGTWGVGKSATDGGEWAFVPMRP